MTKWENNFIEEDIDLHVFLTLDDEDLKKIGNILHKREVLVTR